MKKALKYDKWCQSLQRYSWSLTPFNIDSNKIIFIINNLTKKIKKYLTNIK